MGRGQTDVFTVKNTFIEVDNHFFEEDGFDAGMQGLVCKRQVSEPAFVFGRQLSSKPPLDPLREEQTQLQPVHQLPLCKTVAHNEESSGCDEPETETEPLQLGVDPQFMKMYSSEEPQESNLNANAVPWVQSAVYSQPAMGAMDVMTGFPVQQVPVLQQLGHQQHPLGHAVSPQVAQAPVRPAGLAEQHQQRKGHREQPTPPAEWGETVTVMMRNLPNRYTQQMLLEEVSNAGFAGAFDFFYLPIDPETAANKGYAFINFLDSPTSWRFKVAYEGKQMERFNSSKYVSVSSAALQGLEANFAHYSTARCSRGDPAARPIFLREPKQGGLSRGRSSPSDSFSQSAGRRGGQRRRNNGRSLVDAAAQKQLEQQHRPFQQQPPQGQMQQPPRPHQAAHAAEGNSLVAKFCPYCGVAVQPSHRFCQYCGSQQATSK